LAVVALRCGVPSDPVIAATAKRHGISAEDMRHAYRHPIRVFDLDEGFTMVIGSSRAAELIEIGVVDSASGPVIVHAMRAREKFLGRY
jgi:hypothetical protein